MDDRIKAAAEKRAAEQTRNAPPKQRRSKDRERA